MSCQDCKKNPKNKCCNSIIKKARSRRIYKGQVPIFDLFLVFLATYMTSKYAGYDDTALIWAFASVPATIIVEVVFFPKKKNSHV